MEIDMKIFSLFHKIISNIFNKNVKQFFLKIYK